MSENEGNKLFMKIEKQLEEEKRRRQKINSLEGMIRKGGPQAEQAKKALMRLQREMEERGES